MVKEFHFSCLDGRMKVTFQVDLDVFTVIKAQTTLDFYDWFYDKDNDTVEEAVKKYALEAFCAATREGAKNLGILNEHFKNRAEGFAALGEKSGIEISEFQFLEIEDSDIKLETTKVRQ